MKKQVFIFILNALLILFSACSGQTENTTNNSDVFDASDTVANDTADTSVSNDVNDIEVKPHIKIISPADHFLTNKKTITVEGSVSGMQNNDTVLLNGNPVQIIDNKFHSSLTLKQGENSIKAELKNSDVSDSIIVILDILPPVIKVTNPLQGALLQVNGGNVTIDFTVSSDTPIKQVFVNNKEIKTVYSGQYSILVQPEKGENITYIMAIDQLGNKVTRQVSYIVGVTKETEFKKGARMAIYVAKAGMTNLSSVIGNMIDNSDFTQFLPNDGLAFSSEMFDVKVNAFSHSAGTALQLTLYDENKIYINLTLKNVQLNSSLIFNYEENHVFPIKIKTKSVNFAGWLTLTQLKSLIFGELEQDSFNVSQLSATVNDSDLFKEYPELKNQIIDIISGTLVKMLTSYFNSLLKNLITDLSSSYDITFKQGKLNLAAILKEFHINTKGITLKLEILVKTSDIRKNNKPYSMIYSSDPSFPEMDAGTGVQIVVNRDLFNLIFYNAWQNDFFNFTIDQNFSDEFQAGIQLNAAILGELLNNVPNTPSADIPVKINVTSDLYPFIRFSNRSDQKIELIWGAISGDVISDQYSWEKPLTQFAASLSATMSPTFDSTKTLLFTPDFTNELLYLTYPETQISEIDSEQFSSAFFTLFNKQIANLANRFVLPHTNLFKLNNCSVTVDEKHPDYLSIKGKFVTKTNKF